MMPESIASGDVEVPFGESVVVVERIKRALMVLNEAMGGAKDDTFVLRPEGVTLTVKAVWAMIASVVGSQARQDPSSPCTE
jgi:hypothetical protein